jgi:DNA-binding beta-propeller fold protein YncE
MSSCAHPGTSLIALLFATIACASSPVAEQTEQSGPRDDQRRANWFPPLAQFGGYGFTEGRLLRPQSVAIDDERIFVLDTGNHRVQVFSLKGKYLTGWGKKGSHPEEFLFPNGIALGTGNEVFVLDAGNDRVQVFNIAGKFLRQWAISRPRKGEPGAKTGIATSGEQILILDRLTAGIHVYTREGIFLTSFGSYGENAGQFKEPAAIAVDPEGNLYVADAGNHRVQKFDLGGTFLSQWGSWGSPRGFLSNPTGIAFAQHQLFICDSDNHRVQVFDASGKFLYQWGAPITRPDDGLGHLHFPKALAADKSASHVVLCEPIEHRCQVFSLRMPDKVQPAVPAWWDHSLELAHHASESGALKSKEPLSWQILANDYFAVLEQDTYSIQVFNPGSKFNPLVARMGRPGLRLGEFCAPKSLAMDISRRRIYVLDAGNRRIQVLELRDDPENPSAPAPYLKVVGALSPGITSPGSLNDTRQRISLDAMCLDSNGILHVLDGSNEVILKFDIQGRMLDSIRVARRPSSKPSKFIGMVLNPSEKITYILDEYGSEVLAYSSDGNHLFSWGQPDRERGDYFKIPSGITIDIDGCVYVTDSGLHVVKKFDGKGNLVDSWGNYGHGPGQFSCPQGITVIGPNRIVVDDTGNHRSQMFTLKGVFLCEFPKGGRPTPR